MSLIWPLNWIPPRQLRMKGWLYTKLEETKIKKEYKQQVQQCNHQQFRIPP